MSGIFDYLKWRGDLTFTQDPPNAVDALIFSGLAYVRYGCRAEEKPEEPILLKEAAEDFFTLEDYETRSRVQRDLDLLHAAASTVWQYETVHVPGSADSGTGNPVCRHDLSAG